MLDQLKVYSALIISSSLSFNNSLNNYLKNYNINDLTYTSDLGFAKRIILEKRFDFIIINSPIANDSLIKYSSDIASVNGPITLLFVKNIVYSDSIDQLTKAGIFCVSKPANDTTINYALNWIISAHNRFKKLEKKAISVESKMQEIRLVNKAKWLLIEKENLSEEKAHKEIEKQAMNLCLSKKEIAEKIIEKYEK